MPKHVTLTDTDTDGTLSANSDTKLASQKAIKTYSGLYVNSKAGGLVTNGSGLYGDNTNFTGYTYLATDKPTGASGSFKTPNTSQNLGTTDELIAVDPFQRYRYSFSAKQISGSGNFYGSVVPYDIDKIQITPSTYMVQPGTLTTLAVELKAGDTTMTLTNATNWYNGGGGSYLRRAIFWNYTDSTGYTWPAETYSLNNTGYDFWNSGGISGNVVTLKTTYAGVTVPVGTAVSNGSDGSTYMYIGATNVAGPASWTNYSGDFGGAINPSTTAASVYLPIPTAYIKTGFLYNMSGSSSYQAFANINLRVIEKLDTDGTLTANSDTKIASQKATKTYADTKVAGAASSTDNAVARFDGTTGKLAQNSVVTIGDTGNITTTGTTITLNTKNIVSGSGNLTLTDFNSVQIGSVRNDNGNLSTIGAVKVLEWSSNTSNPSARVTPTGASQKALVVKGLSSQTGNLQEWQDSSGTSLMSVSSAGALTSASDIEITDTTKGVILKSPDGTRWRVKIDNTGTLTTTSI